MEKYCLETFSSEKFGSIRSMRIEGEPWFVAAEICERLKIKNSRQALSRLDADEKGVILMDTPGGAQNVSIISEPGFYALALSCRKTDEDIKAFKRWVVHDVIPSIRKTGSYTAPWAQETQSRPGFTYEELASVTSLIVAGLTPVLMQMGQQIADAVVAATAIQEGKGSGQISSESQRLCEVISKVGSADPYAHIRIQGDCQAEDLSLGRGLGYSAASQTSQGAGDGTPGTAQLSIPGQWKKRAKGKLKMLAGFLYSASCGKHLGRTISYEKFELAVCSLVYKKMQKHYEVDLNAFKACGPFGSQRKGTGTLQTVADNKVLRQYFDDVMDWYLTRCNEELSQYSNDGVAYDVLAFLEAEVMQ